ncbi:hypothetical protein [Oryzibacter oryziterrae]|uniref:hypothetical protein n=1 Tax=Oryzibacter oryziterrae TaxID=2766474 RepID=UPI002729C14B|nr:hypothetical protein [Oryzibacter oryziterrae]
MADYYPVLKRAISSLPSGAGDARRAVYEKARAALVRQLNSYNPPLSPAEISDQRMALEECIRRVEAENAEAAFGLAPEPVPAPVAQAPLPPPEPAPMPAHQPLPTSQSSAPRPPVEVKVATPPLPTRAAPTEAPRPASARVAEDMTDAKVGAGLSALTKTLRQADTLGEASAQAVRSARQAIEEDVEPLPSPVKVEPEFAEAPRPAPRAPAREPVIPKRQEPRPRQPAAAHDVSIDQPAPSISSRDSAGPAMPWPIEDQAPARRFRLILAAAVVVGLAAIGAGAYIFKDSLSQLVASTDTPTEQATTDTTQPDSGEPKILDRLPIEGGDANPVAPDAHEVQTVAVAPPTTVDPDLPPPPAGGQAAAPVAPAPAAVTPAPTAVTTAPSLTQTAPDATALAPQPATETPAPVASTEPPPATAAEPAPAVPAPATADASQGIQVAQKAILYEEPIPGSPGSKLDGQVVWSLVNEPPLPGEKPVTQIRAQIEVPDLKLKLKLSIHKNDDQALPASHIVELNFDIPTSFPGRSIDMTPGMIAKQTEDARGDPVIGAVAKVSDNIYWLALSGLDQDISRNVALMKDREWIDIPIRYGNRRRAILTFEKGTPGDKVFADAFKAWGQ